MNGRAPSAGVLFLLEMIAVITAHVLLYSFAMDHFSGTVQRASSLDVFSASGPLRDGAAYHYALTGRWPSDASRLPAFSQATIAGSPWTLGLADGVVHARKDEKGQPLELSLRPATLVNNPTGPLLWVCGQDQLAADWQVTGEADTPLNPHLLPKGCRSPGTVSPTTNRVRHASPSFSRGFSK